MQCVASYKRLKNFGHIAHVVHVANLQWQYTWNRPMKIDVMQIKKFWSANFGMQWGCIHPLNLIIFRVERGRWMDSVRNEQGPQLDMKLGMIFRKENNENCRPGPFRPARKSPKFPRSQLWMNDMEMKWTALISIVCHTLYSLLGEEAASARVAGNEHKWFTGISISFEIMAVWDWIAFSSPQPVS